MNEQDPERFEAELRRLRPARPPAEFMDRLVAARPERAAEREPEEGAAGVSPVWVGWRWLRIWAPITAAAAAVAWVAWRQVGELQPVPVAPAAAVQHDAVASRILEPVMRADDVELGHQLVAAYDAVAELPGGEPVRFRCREWVDEVVLRDSARGVVIERRTPRFEAVPVCFETD